MNYHAAKAFILDKLERDLSPDLTYHGLHHTLDVLLVTDELCRLEGISAYDSMLLLTAASFHDCGFLLHNHDHEKLGCQVVREHLPRFDYSAAEIERICSMIMATKIPQRPRDAVEAILCDADLDYLGREDFYPIGATLFEELRTYGVVKLEQDWNRLQVRFLDMHSYFTPTNLARRKPRKEQYLAELRRLVATY